MDVGARGAWAGRVRGEPSGAMTVVCSDRSWEEGGRIDRDVCRCGEAEDVEERENRLVSREAGVRFCV